jgi:pyruvate dehydrogenase E1 component
VLEAAAVLGDQTEAICVTSADLLFRAFRARAALGEDESSILDQLLPAERAAPMVTVLDGAPNALAFLAAVNGVPLTPLGVTRFGQSGDLEDVYRHHGIDAETVVGAALDLL